MKKTGTKNPPATGVRAGDEIYFRSAKGPNHGRVICHGSHGCTVDSGGRRHKVRWDDVLGHRKRIGFNAKVVDQGDDGAIVEDETGGRVYLHGANFDNDNEPDNTTQSAWDLLAKENRMSKSMVLLLKSGKISNRAGLHLENLTDKAGHQTKRWKRGDKEAASGRPRADDNSYASGKVGNSVSFKSSDGTVKGKIVSSGKDGATIQDDGGNKHKVLWKDVLKTPTKPDWDARQDNESDKAYAKRVIDKGESPEHLPEEHDRYFNTGGSTHIPLDRLHSTKRDDENAQGGDNGPKRMQAAWHGALGKRDPITVMPHKDKDGHYEVVDGNGTLTSVKKYGWKGLPTKIVSREEGEASIAKDKAKDLAKAILPPEKHKELGKAKGQPIPATGRDELFKRAAETLDTLKTWLNRGKGIASQMGYTTMTKSPDDVSSDEWGQHKGMLFIAPLKGQNRAAEKVEADYSGDWSKLTDVVRCTLAADSLHDISEAIKTLEAHGMKPARTPKNKFLNPTPQGYMDMNFIIQMPDGILAEIQFNVKDMMRAKNEGHHYYEITRKIEDSYKKRGAVKGDGEPDYSLWSAEDLNAFKDADAKQAEVYGKAWSEHVKKHYGHSHEPLTKSSNPLILLVKNKRVAS
jgi:hypothetical protein